MSDPQSTQLYETRLSTQGRVSVPPAVREHLNLAPGDSLVFLVGITGIRLTSRAQLVGELAGSLTGYLSDLSGAEHEAVRTAVVEHYGATAHRVEAGTDDTLQVWSAAGELLPFEPAGHANPEQLAQALPGRRPWRVQL